MFALAGTFVPSVIVIMIDGLSSVRTALVQIMSVMSPLEAVYV